MVAGGFGSSSQCLTGRPIKTRPGNPRKKKKLYRPNKPIKTRPISMRPDASHVMTKGRSDQDRLGNSHIKRKESRPNKLKLPDIAKTIGYYSIACARDGRAVSDAPAARWRNVCSAACCVRRSTPSGAALYSSADWNQVRALIPAVKRRGRRMRHTSYITEERPPLASSVARRSPAGHQHHTPHGWYAGTQQRACGGGARARRPRNTSAYLLYSALPSLSGNVRLTFLFFFSHDAPAYHFSFQDPSLRATKGA